MPHDLRPYLVNACYQFIADRNETQYISVLVDERCVVPKEYVKEQVVQEGHPPVPIIILNISMSACRRLMIPQEEEALTFDGTFNGRHMQVYVPYDCLLAIYPKEDPTHAMGFGYIPPEARKAIDHERNMGENPPPPPPKGAPSLKVIK
jgi:stringent starvation protein B